MKANESTTAELAPAAAGRPAGRVRRGVAAAVIGLLAVSACTSDPGPKRVAQDIIKAESLDNPDLDEDCLLEKLDDYENDDLVAIADDLDKENSADQAAAEEALAQFQADLEACN